jgi:hypothetical protein
MDCVPFLLEFKRPPDRHFGHLAVVWYGVHAELMRNLNNNNHENK